MVFIHFQVFHLNKCIKDKKEDFFEDHAQRHSINNILLKAGKGRVYLQH